MAVLANTFTTAQAKVNREELSDVVSKITPEDTPIYSMIGKEKGKSTHPEWIMDELAAPTENFHIEGNEYNFDAITPPTRLGNYSQIFRKTWIVSGTQQAVDNAGNVEKVKYQKLKKGVEVRRDIELAIVANTASKSTEPRKTGSLASWYTTNVTRGARGTNGGYSQATGLTRAAGPGTRRAFTKQLLDSTMQEVYNSGGTLKYAVCSPYVKSVFTTFMSDSNVASFRYAASTSGKNTIISTADIYEGDFGKVTIMPNRVQATNTTVASNVHLLDPALCSWKTVRKIHNDKDVAKTGDAIKGVIIGEGALCVKNEKGIGVVADVFGTSATA